MYPTPVPVDAEVEGAGSPLNSSCFRFCPATSMMIYKRGLVCKRDKSLRLYAGRQNQRYGWEISKTTVGKLTVPGLFTISLPIHAQSMLRPHNVVLQYARRYTGVSSLRKHYTSVNRMPWLMKAEPDSRVVKGKDVKVRLRPLSLGETPLAVITALIPVLSGRF